MSGDSSTPSPEQVWLLGGQSNMEGLGRLPGATADSRVFALDLQTASWVPARDPLHRLEISPYEPHRRALAGSTEAAGSGPGIPFANEIVRLSGRSVGLIPVAVRSSTLQDWSPDVADGLYAAAIDAARRSSSRVHGVIWYQGESEALLDEAGHYPARTRAVFDAFRRDLGGISVYHVQLGRLLLDQPSNVIKAWNAVRDFQRRPSAIGSDGFASAVDLALDDEAHLSAESASRLGRRLARLTAGEARSIVIEHIEVLDGRIIVTVGGAQGGLATGPKADAVSIRDETGVDLDVTTDLETEDNAVVVHLSRAARRGEYLWYGYGLNPNCNLVDAKDMAVPAFGPIPLRRWLGRRLRR